MSSFHLSPSGSRHDSPTGKGDVQGTPNKAPEDFPLSTPLLLGPHVVHGLSRTLRSRDGLHTYTTFRQNPRRRTDGVIINASHRSLANTNDFG